MNEDPRALLKQLLTTLTDSQKQWETIRKHLESLTYVVSPSSKKLRDSAIRHFLALEQTSEAAKEKLAGINWWTKKIYANDREATIRALDWKERLKNGLIKNEPFERMTDP